MLVRFSGGLDTVGWLLIQEQLQNKTISLTEIKVDSVLSALLQFVEK